MDTSELITQSSSIFSMDDFVGEDAKTLTNLVGIESAIRIICYFGGVSIYVGKVDYYNLLKKYVCKKYSGKNVRALSLQMGVSERTVYQWLEKGGVKLQSRHKK